MIHLDGGCSVVVCAPTGSGKTVIAEYAVHRALAQQQRVFYTTPLKALSNQKYRDLCEVFGPENVGLLTGDISVNRDAAVVVMTTEIFRNMLYGMPLGEMGTTLHGLQAVILDECHYMNDSQRGTVWEETIIYCPSPIQLIALSATIANSIQLTDWIDRVHGPTKLVYSDFRPVPLRHHFCSPKGLFPLLNEKRTGLFSALKSGVRAPKRVKGGGLEAPDTKVVVSYLASRDMLPAIYFIFSRRGCDQALQKVAGLRLVSSEEQAKLKAQIDHFVATQPDAIRAQQLDHLYNGIAVHHAGVLPLWKGLVEELFQQGLIKVVFATETLAAGINMPARTTVIGSLSKRTNEGHRGLQASEFLQMAGRAGRRGMDPVGHVVVLASPFETPQDAARLALAESDPLVSQFTPSYGMVLNLLDRHSLGEARILIERSFGQYLATLHLEPLFAERKELELELAELTAQKPPVTAWDLMDYEKLKNEVRSQRKRTQRPEKATAPLRGQVVSILGDQQVLLGIWIESIPFDNPFQVCLTQDNHWLLLEPKQIIAVHPTVLDLPQGLMTPSSLAMEVGASAPGDLQTALVTTRIMTGREDPELSLENHPAHRVHRQTWQKYYEKLQRVERKLQHLVSESAQAGEYYWLEFLKLVHVLEYTDFLQDSRPTVRGRVAQALRGENELWLASAMLSGELDHLTAPQLAAVCCALVSEPPRPQSWVMIEASSPVEEVCGGLRNLRREVIRHQRQEGVLIPCWLETKLIGLVEQWASGVNWEELGRLSNLDEGDLVRLLRRTLDLLRQIPHTPGLPVPLTQTAREAQLLMDRFPVSEVI